LWKLFGRDAGGSFLIGISDAASLLYRASEGVPDIALILILFLVILVGVRASLVIVIPAGTVTIMVESAG